MTSSNAQAPGTFLYSIDSQLLQTKPTGENTISHQRNNKNIEVNGTLFIDE
jgi:hypothetical protein